MRFMPFVIKQYRFGSYNASVSVSLYPISVSNRIIFTAANTPVTPEARCHYGFW